MRIAHLCNSDIPSTVASSIQVMKMCQALAGLGHDVTLFCPELEDRRAEAGPIHEHYGVEASFGLRRLPRPGPPEDPAPAALRWLRWHLWAGRYDLVYARCNAWRPFRLHKVTRPLILEAHLLRRARSIERLFQRPLLRGLVPISDGLRQDYVEAYPLDGVEVLVAHDGADPVRAALPMALPGTGAVRCGYVGNLYRGKGVEIVLPLAARCPGVDFHVFGGTPEQIADWQAAGSGAPANLWFHGALRPADTDAARLACDLLLAPYQDVVQGVGDRGNLVRWMSPLKLFEYMAAGKAIVASDLPTLREVLRHDDNAWLCPPADLDAWTAAITTLAADADRRRRLGARALSDFAARHSWQARAAHIIRVLAPPG